MNKLNLCWMDAELSTEAELTSTKCFGSDHVRVFNVQAAFAPSEDEITWAQKVIGLEGGASQLDGVMIDKPVVDRAKRILSRVGAK